MVRTVRWGILSTGAVAASFTEALLETPGAEVLAVASRSRSSAVDFAERFRISRAYGRWSELAADEDVDVVYIATPPSAHHAAAAICLTAGRAVLCEKPFTTDADQAEALVELARGSGRFLMEAMWMYCHPLIRRIKELVGEDAIGEVRVVQADFGLAGPLPENHRLLDPLSGGGALLDLGVYPVSLAHALLGPPSTVRAFAGFSPRGVDLNTGILLGWESGALATLSCSIVAGTAVTASVTGTRGRIDLAPGFFYPDRITLHRAGREPEDFLCRGPRASFRHEIEEVMRCLAAGETESPMAPLDRTVDVMRTLDRIRGAIGVQGA